MSKKVKNIIEKELQTRFQEVSECMVVSLRGIGGIENNQLRGDLLKKNIHVTVIKNSLARRAFDGLNRKGFEKVLSGPSAIAYGGDSIVDVAKAVVEWSGKMPKFEVKGGYLDGQALDAEQAKGLSKLPTRVELQGQIVSLMMSPGAKVASAALAPGARIAGCIKALVEKLEKAAPAEAPVA